MPMCIHINKYIYETMQRETYIYKYTSGCMCTNIRQIDVALHVQAAHQRITPAMSTDMSGWLYK